jgi:hypothetical protein
MALIGMIGATPALAAPPPPASSRPEPPKPAARRYRPYVERGNYIPAPYAFAALGLGANLRAGAPTQAEGALAFAVGLTKVLWVDGSLGTLRVAPNVVFHSAQIGPNLLVVDKPAFELDAMLHVSGPSDDGRPIEQIEPGLYTVARAGHAVRVDSILAFDLNPGPRSTFGFRVPATIAFQISEHVYGSFTTGVGTGSLANPRETTAIPAGISIGWSDYVASMGTAAVAIVPSITFPELVRPWANEPFRPGTIMAGITFYYVWKY